MAHLLPGTGGHRHQSRASESLLFVALPRVFLLLLFAFLLYYLLRKQQQRLSELRLPSGIIPKAS